MSMVLFRLSSAQGTTNIVHMSIIYICPSTQPTVSDSLISDIMNLKELKSGSGICT